MQSPCSLADAMNLCLSLTTHGLEDTAFYILKTFPTFQSESAGSDMPSLGNFFLRHCVTMEKVSAMLLISRAVRIVCGGNH